MKPEPMDMTSIGVTVPADAKEGTRLYIAFKNVSGAYKKVLVIEVKNV